MTDEPTTTTLAVLGGGPGGYVAAIRAAQLGVPTVLVEAADLGGVCLNEGCVPSKALIHDAGEVDEDLRQGLIGSDGAQARFERSLHERTATIDKLRRGVAGLLRANGVTTLAGVGRLASPHLLEVSGPSGNQRIRFDHAILATGSEPLALPGLPVDGRFVLTAREVLALEHLPRRVVVVGGGYIGLELASALRRFGVDIVVVEATDRLLPGIDPPLAEHLERHLRRSGIDIRLKTSVVAARDGTIEIEHESAIARLESDAVVVAVGRSPRSAGIGLEAVGVEVAPTGHVIVDEYLRTNQAHIRAIGDLTAGPALAHRAMAQGRAAAESVAGQPGHFRPAAIPAVVFTTPEIATVGLTLAEAVGRGVDAVEVRFPLGANARGMTLSTDGFGLLVHERDSGLVLGVHAIGPAVGELIGIATLAIEMGAVVEDLAGTIFPHPTLSEMFGELGDLAFGLPIHTLP